MERMDPRMQQARWRINTTVQRAKSMGLDPNFYLDNNDAYPFFQKLGDLLITGPTHTNVMDVRILLVD